MESTEVDLVEEAVEAGVGLEKREDVGIRKEGRVAGGGGGGGSGGSGGRRVFSCLCLGRGWESVVS